MRTSGWGSAMARSLFVIWLVAQAFRWVRAWAAYALLPLPLLCLSCHPKWLQRQSASTTTGANVNSTTCRLVAISCYRSLFSSCHGWRFSRQTFGLWLSLFCHTSRLVEWDLISHKSTCTILRKYSTSHIFQNNVSIYRYPRRCRWQQCYAGGG